MRKKPLKLLSMFAVLALIACHSLKAQEYMRINLNDGTVMEIAIADIQKLTFDVSNGAVIHPELLKKLITLKVFPNPAKDIVTINYELFFSGEVTIGIYNITGTRLMDINKGSQQAGTYQHHWNTEILSSGTYICRIHQNNEIVSQKIIVKK